jgi:hypothetical protein
MFTFDTQGQENKLLDWKVNYRILILELNNINLLNEINR